MEQATRLQIQPSDFRQPFAAMSERVVLNSDAPTQPAVDDEPALEEALAEYEAAIESSDLSLIEDVLHRHAHLREDLLAYCDNRAAMDDLFAPLRAATFGAQQFPEVSQYDVLELLDGGGMGLVYRAHYQRLNQVVALKVMRSDRLATAEEIRRFRTEAECASRLEHRGIISVFDIGLDNGQPYYSMELVHGESLRDQLLQSGRWSPPEAARLLLGIAEAMAAAHRDGVVHRDLKPANILLDRWGHPRIIDFGLAKCNGEKDIIEPGAFVGTPAYASPEQADGEADSAGPQADVYSLGAILYEMLTGQPPLIGANQLETLEKVITQEPVPVTAHEPDTPSELETICMTCLAKNPADRYVNADELAEDLRRFLSGRPILREPVRYPYVDWLFHRGFDDPITKIAKPLMAFQCIYSISLFAAQYLLLIGWGEPLVWLLVFGGVIPVFIALRTDESTGIWPTNPAERMLWSIWTGVILAHFLLTAALRLSPHSGGFVAAFDQSFSVTPFIVGVGMFIMGGSFFKRNLVWGLLWMALGIVNLIFTPVPWALTAFNLMSVATIGNLIIDQMRSRPKPGASTPTVEERTTVAH